MALILALGAGGCQGRDIVSGVGDSAFVQTMAELQRVRMDSTLVDSAARTAARAAALRRHGVTADQLERAARALADDPARAQALFQAVSGAVEGHDSATTSTEAAARLRGGGRRRTVR